MEVDIQTVNSWMASQKNANGDPIILVDCREPNEFEFASIPGAVLMPMSQFPLTSEQLTELEGKHVVVHCHHGGRSLRVANWFRQNGHPEALSMAGGIDQWSQQIDPSIPRY